MINTITKSEFTAAVHNMNRGDQFSHEALLALFEYYTEYEESTGEQIELDVIAICCEWTEYDNYYQAVQAYDTDCHNLLEDNTLVIYTGEYGSDSSVLVLNY